MSKAVSYSFQKICTVYNEKLCRCSAVQKEFELKKTPKNNEPKIDPKYTLVHLGQARKSSESNTLFCVLVFIDHPSCFFFFFSPCPYIFIPRTFQNKVMSTHSLAFQRCYIKWTHAHQGRKWKKSWKLSGALRPCALRNVCHWYSIRREDKHDLFWHISEGFFFFFLKIFKH